MNARPSRGANRVVEQCRLCGVAAQLQHSHVMPHLMFRPMQKLAPGTPLRFQPRAGGSRPGHLKEYMLCAGCEAQFGAHERVAGRFLTELNDYQLQPREREIRRSSLDYAHLKLFFLSVLWRCAVARDPMTNLVDLGPRLPRLTTLVRTDDPGAQEEYAILLRLLDESPMARNAVLTVPVPMRNVARRGYAMVARGVEISWIVDRRGASRENATKILLEDGTWRIEVIKGSDSFPWCKSVIKAHEQDRERLKNPRVAARLARRHFEITGQPPDWVQD